MSDSFAESGVKVASPSDSHHDFLTRGTELPGHVVGPGEGRRFEFLSSGYRNEIKASAADSDGQLTVLEATFEPGYVVEPHRHLTQIECFYVLDGEIEYRVGESVLRPQIGTFVLVPSGEVHAFSNVGEGPARHLVLVTPGGIEKMFDDISRALEQTVAPRDPNLPGLRGLLGDELVAIWRKHDAEPA